MTKIMKSVISALMPPLLNVIASYSNKIINKKV